MPALPSAAIDHYAGQREIIGHVLAAVERIWGRAAPDDFDAWYAANSDQLTAAIILGQHHAVAGADDYVGQVLTELGTPAAPEVLIDTSPLVGVASDGRDLGGLLYGSIINAKHCVGQGLSPAEAWARAGQNVLMHTQTQLADAARVATGLGITARRSIGYVRMLNPPSCPRCVVLAGRWYRKAGFQRHPGCDCRNIPAAEDHPDDLRTDPAAYFDSLSEAEQDKQFGAADAKAIRDGADIGQVVNAHRGMKVAGVYGQDLAITTEGTTKRGYAGSVIRARGRDVRTTPRLMPEAIYEIAQSRLEELDLLRKNGYIMDRATKLEPAIAAPAAAVVPEPAEPVAAAGTKAVAAAAAKRARSPFTGRSAEELSARFAEKIEAGEFDAEFDSLEAEIQKRDDHARAMRDRRAATRDTKAAAQDAEYDRLLRQGIDDETAIERAYGVPVEDQRRRNARSMLTGWGFDGKSLDAQVRAWHRDEAHREWLAAEDATNGYMLSKAGERAGADPRKLWSIPEDRARKYASEELRGWWDRHGRTTAAELKAQLLDPVELARIQSRRRDFLT